MQDIEHESQKLRINTKFFGFINSVRELWDTIKKFDIGIIPNLPTANYLVTSVNRPYKYALLGIPILTPHYPGIQDIVGELKIPKFDPRSPRSIAKALEKMMINLEKYDFRDDIRKMFCWEKKPERCIIEFYQRLLSSTTNN